jgi:O-antigen/teichoic acid export membrane protein
MHLADRLGRHSLTYGVGAVLLVVTSLVTLAVLTRLMPPSEFGTLFVLLALSTLVSILYNLGTLQGTLGLVFGRGDEGGDEGGGDLESLADADGRGEAPAGEKRDALGTGLLLTAAVALVGTGLLWMAAADIARLLDSPREEAVRLAAVAAALTSLWRMLLAVPRFERRPKFFVVFNVARPALAIALAAPFVARGGGVEAVLAGMAIATGSLLVLALVLLRGSFRLRFRAGLILPIMKLGAVFIPLVLSIYVISHGGVLILSRAVSSSEIGLYGVAVTFGMVILSAATVFFMAWIPMKRTSVFVAVHKERGHGWVHSTLTTHLLLGVSALLVMVTGASGALVGIAGPKYSAAAVIIPAVGTAAIAQVSFLLSYRISAFRWKRSALAALSILAAITFVSTAFMLVEPLGVYGVPLATFVAFLLPGFAMLALNQRGPRPIPFEYSRLARIGAITAACVAGYRGLEGAVGAFRPLVDVGIVLAYPCLLVVSRAISRADITRFARIVRSVLTPPAKARVALAGSLAALPATQVHVLAEVTRPSGRLVAPVPPGSLVTALRALAAAGAVTDCDEAIGRYLMSSRSRAERDSLARRLWSQGVPPAELDRLETTLLRLKQLPKEVWPEAELTRAKHGLDQLAPRRRVRRQG